jgi:hypothetical protein
MAILTANGVALPAPVSIKTDDEIIWSSNTGRVANGDMEGDVVKEKKTLTIEWGILQDTEMEKIENNVIAGYFPLIFDGGGGAGFTIESYRGTLSAEHIGDLDDGIYWYRKATVKIVQK